MKIFQLPTRLCGLSHRRTLVLLVLSFLTLKGLCASLASTLPSPDTAWWGYWNTSMGFHSVTDLTSGTNVFAIKLSADAQQQLRDCQVHGLRFYFSNKSGVTSAKAWLSTSLTEAPDVAETDIPLDQLCDMIHDMQPTVVMFPTPVNILSSQDATIYAGFTLTLKPEAYCQMITSGKRADTPQNSTFLNGTSVEKEYGALAMQLIVGGGTLKALDIRPADFGEQVAVATDLATTAEVELTQWGTEPLESVDLQVIQSTSQAPVMVTRLHYDLGDKIDELGYKKSFTLPITLPQRPYQYETSLKVTSVNGQPYDATAKGSLVVLKQATTKRTVMEEFTATWSPDYTRGAEGIQLLEEKYGDQFIPISIHVGDLLELSDYANSTIAQRVGNTIPSCSIDRIWDCDPYYGEDLSATTFAADKVVKKALERMPTADISVDAVLSDDVVTCDVTTTFRHDADTTPMRLIIVITADGLVVGDGAETVFNRMPIGVIGVNDGLEGSIAAPIVCDKPQHYSCNVTIAGTTALESGVVLRPNKLSAVAMLIDTRTGTIVNAANIRVKTNDSEGIAELTSPHANSTTIYDLLGRRLNVEANASLSTHHPSLKKGFYIINGQKRLLQSR